MARDCMTSIKQAREEDEVDSDRFSELSVVEEEDLEAIVEQDGQQVKEK